MTDTRIAIDSNKVVIANFLPIRHTLTIQIVGGGSTTLVAGEHNYNEGLLMSLLATPDKGWKFEGWTVDVVDSSSISTIVTIENDKTFISHFSQINAKWCMIGSVIAGVLILCVVIWSLIRRWTA